MNEIGKHTCQKFYLHENATTSVLTGFCANQYHKCFHLMQVWKIDIYVYFDNLLCIEFKNWIILKICMTFTSKCNIL